MKRKKRSDNNEEISYWESTTDLMSALVLIVLLIFALVLLYIVRAPEDSFKDMDEGDTYEETDESFETQETETGWDESWDDEGGADDDDGYGHGYEDDHDAGGGGDDHDYDYEYPGIVDSYGKAAIHVTVTDMETQKPIRLAGTEFQLFKQGDILQILCAYYPEKIDFSKFETEADGFFYLPEKIPGGAYYFHELTVPDGYDLSEDVGFTVNQAYDWTQPLEINIPLSPSRNVISVKVTDCDSGNKVGNAAFDVVASEDITTFDGTVRFRKGQVVDRIVCDEDGAGESAELYLGAYELHEVVIPEYYVQNPENTEARVLKKGSIGEKELLITSEMTSVDISVRDELNPGMPIEGAEFVVTQEGAAGKARTFTTDAQGDLHITELAKNKTYSIVQKSSAEGYRFTDRTYTCTVAEDGTISGNPHQIYDISNRILRIKVGIRDKILRHYVSDVSVGIYNDQDELVSRWDSTGIAQSIEGLAPGRYKVMAGTGAAKPVYITLEDTCEEQNFSVSVWTNTEKFWWQQSYAQA